MCNIHTQGNSEEKAEGKRVEDRKVREVENQFIQNRRDRVEELAVKSKIKK